MKLAGQPVPEPTDVSVPAAAALPASWDNIEVGHMVIAAEGQPWYAAIVVARDGDMLTLKWRDYPAGAERYSARQRGRAVETKSSWLLTSDCVGSPFICCFRSWVP